MLEIRELRAGYGKVNVLSGIDLTVPVGRSVGLFGRNGAGKSTLAKAVMGLVTVRSGTVAWRGADLTRVRTERIVRGGASLVPQSRGLFPSLTVNENLAMSSIRLGLTRAQRAERSASMYDLFPALGERRDLSAASLSGGQQQMLAIGMALVRQPDLLILDEPSIGLAPLVLEEIKDLVNSLRERELTVVIAEQNIRWAWGMVDEGYILEQGRLVEHVQGDVGLAERAMARHLGVH